MANEESRKLSSFGTRGFLAGELIHTALELINFKTVSECKDYMKYTSNKDLDVFFHKMIKNNFSVSLTDDNKETLKKIIWNTLKTPLLFDNDKRMSLCQIDDDKNIREFEFYLPFSPTKEKLSTQEDFIWKFKKLNKGYLKGFIDIAFESFGKYWLADFKSNYMGSNAPEYDQEAMYQKMLDEKYHLQLFIYLSSLYIYLKKTKKSFNYDKDFGGAFYLFLRGMNPDNDIKNQYGIYFYKPKEKRLLEFMEQFTGKQSENQITN